MEDADAETNSSVIPIVVDEEWLEAVNQSDGETNRSFIVEQLGNRGNQKKKKNGEQLVIFFFISGYLLFY